MKIQNFCNQLQCLLQSLIFTPYYIREHQGGNKRKEQRAQNIGDKIGKLGRTPERHKPLQQFYNPAERNRTKNHCKRAAPPPAWRRDTAAHVREMQVKLNSKAQTAEHKEMPYLVKPLECRNFNLRQRMRIQRQKKNNHHHYSGKKTGQQVL